MSTVATGPAELPVTIARRDGMSAVSDGRVTYEWSSASYALDGRERGNWFRRTMVELEGAGLVQLPDGDGTVTMTAAGRRWLEGNQPE